MRSDQPGMTTTVLRGSLALLIIAPLINVGPVNISAFLLLLASSLWLAKHPDQWWAYWWQHRPLLLITLLLPVAFWLSNLLNDNEGIMAATFSQSRWLLLLTLAAPAIAGGFDRRTWRRIFYFVCVTTLMFTAIYCIDTGLYWGFNSNFMLDVVDAERVDLLRPSWVFNPHPFSRTLVAALLLFAAALATTGNRMWRMIYLAGMLGLAVILIAGAVRTALLSLAVIAACGVVLYARRGLFFGLAVGFILGALGLWTRAQIFPQQSADQSLQFRTALFEQGILAFLEKPWFGGGYQAAREIPWPESLQAFTATQTLATTNTHVQWLEMLVSYGLIGGVLFVLFWSLWGWFVFTAQRQATGKFRLAGFLLLLNWVSLTVAGFTTVYRESEWALWLITVLGAVWLTQHRGEPEEPNLHTGH